MDHVMEYLHNVQGADVSCTCHHICLGLMEDPSSQSTGNEDQSSLDGSSSLVMDEVSKCL